MECPADSPAMPMGDTIRRILSGSILASWIVFAISAGAHGAGLEREGAGLLRAMQAMLMDPAFACLSAQASGAAVILVAAVTLAAMLWAAMFAICTGREDFLSPGLVLFMSLCLLLLSLYHGPNYNLYWLYPLLVALPFF